MIGLVSSCIFPPGTAAHDGPRTWIDNDQRLEQTRQTVASLMSNGITRIVIADNSGHAWRDGAEGLLAPAEVLHLRTPQFRNKGIAEMHMLRAALPTLPPGEPILKLSGRYSVTHDFADALGDADVAARVYVRGRHWSMSTRAYLVRDAATYARLLDDAFRELFAYAARIVGPRSLLRIVRNSLRPATDRFPYDDPPDSIENAWGRALQLGGYRVNQLAELGVEGYAGGFAGLFVRE